jgi:GNAT superfamily N-acetyltransferase
VFQPPKSPPAVWRPLRLGDAGALAALTIRIHDAEGLHDLPGPEMIRWFLGLPSIDLVDDTIGAFAPDGTAIADAEVMLRGGDGSRRAIVFVNVDPEHPALGPLLLAWAEDRARLRLADAPPGAERDIRVIVEEHRSRWRHVVEEAGFRESRHFVKMRMPLRPPLPEPPRVPEGIEIVPWSDDLDRGAWAVSNASFADHWGSAEQTWEEWRASYAGDPDAFLPDHSFVAVHDDEVVAICLCEHDPEDIERTGIREFWVGRVGTTAAWRRRGLGTALILRSLASASADCYERTALSVDEDSQTNATAIYERIGYRVTEREIHYLKPA